MSEEMNGIIANIKKTYEEHCDKDIPEEQAIRFAHEMYEYVLFCFGDVPKQIDDLVVVHFEEMFKRALLRKPSFVIPPMGNLNE